MFFCSDVKYDSDVEDNRDINGGGGDDEGGMENVFLCCSNGKLKKSGEKKVRE